MKRFLFLIVVLCAMAAITAVLFFASSFSFSSATLPIGDIQPIQTPAPSPSPPARFTLLFAGDIMLDRGVEYKLKQNGADWKFPFLLIADELRKADMVFANLESQISDKGYNVGSIYSFRADPASLEGLVFAGIDVVSVTNNHSFDYTKAAFSDSLLRLQAADIAYTGGGQNIAEAREPVIKDIQGTRIGFLAYSSFGGASWQATQNQSGILFMDENNLDQLQIDIQRAKQKADILVVSIHAGNEYQKYPTAFQQEFGRKAIDAGADLVIGHHPHVTQPLEQYKNGWIAYSLGNFIFDQAFSAETMQGAILQVTLLDKQITQVELRQTKLNENYQVYFP